MGVVTLTFPLASVGATIVLVLQRRIRATLWAKGKHAMDQPEFDRVALSFAAFHAEFAPLFGRKEAQRRSEQYLRGLLVQQTDRRNAENVAETIEGATPRTLQRLLTEAPWQTEPMIDQLQGRVGARL